MSTVINITIEISLKNLIAKGINFLSKFNKTGTEKTGMPEWLIIKKVFKKFAK